MQSQTDPEWLEGSKPFQIVHQFNLPRKRVKNIVDQFIPTGGVGPGIGGKRRTVRTDDVVLYKEFCKQRRPNVYGTEIQKQLIENQVVLLADMPSQASTQVLKERLKNIYSFKHCGYIN